MVSTRDRILDAAEALFAEQGFDASSLRGITTAAGVNLAAVNYHFGSKESLLVEVLERRLGPVNDERLRHLDALEATGSAPSAEAILRAFLAPPLKITREWGKSGALFMQFAGRLHTESNQRLRDLFLGRFAVVISRFDAALSRALPHLPHDELHWRLHFVIGAMAHALVWTRVGACPAKEDHQLGDDEVLEQLVAFSLAGVTAPPMESLP